MSSVRRKPEASRGRATPRVPANEDARLCSLHRYSILDTPPEAAFERIARLAGCFLKTPVAIVSFVDENRQWFKSVCGLNLRETPRQISFCSHAIESDGVMVVPDAARDARFVDNPLVVGEPFLRFYAGAPLRTPDGHKLGTLCVLDYRPRHLKADDRRILQELAATVVDELELRRAGAELRAQIAQREQVERELAAALRSVESQVAARTAELSRRNGQLRAEIVVREEAERARRDSELQFRELAENIKEVFWMCSADANQLLYVSPAYEAIWGRPLAENGLLPVAWLDTIHPDDRARVRAHFAERAAMDGFEEEYRVLRPDGAECWVHDRAFAIRDAAGTVYRIAGVAADITERKRQQALVVLRARQQQVVAELGESALQGGEIDALLTEACERVKNTMSVDLCGVAEHQPDRGVFVARAVAGLSGGPPLAAEIPDGKASGSGYVVLTGEPVVVEDAESEGRFQVSHWSRENGARSGIVVPIGGDGTHLPTYGTFNVFSRAPRVFTSDDVFFLQGVANVLAAAISRRCKDEALRTAKEEAELANSAKSSFLSRMSHELRTPLNAILGFSQLLQMDAPTERQQECLKHVLASGQQLLAMIDDVLDISRLELGHGTLVADAVVPRQSIALSIDLIRPLSAPRRVTVAQEDDPAADRAVLVNRLRLNQVLLNLLTNAVKYNKPGGRVTVSCRTMPAARLRIAVTDDGPGIAPEDLGRLFVPFDRLGAERTDVPGTGLGLALCKNLVEAQGRADRRREHPRGRQHVLDSTSARSSRSRRAGHAGGKEAEAAREPAARTPGAAPADPHRSLRRGQPLQPAPDRTPAPAPSGGAPADRRVGPRRPGTRPPTASGPRPARLAPARPFRPRDAHRPPGRPGDAPDPRGRRQRRRAARQHRRLAQGGRARVPDQTTGCAPDRGNARRVGLKPGRRGRKMGSRGGGDR